MSDSVDQLQALTLKQQKRIKALQQENQELQSLVSTLEKRIQKLEETRMAIDHATADIPIGLDLIPEDADGQPDR